MNPRKRTPDASVPPPAGMLIASAEVDDALASLVAVLEEIGRPLTPDRALLFALVQAGGRALAARPGIRTVGGWFYGFGYWDEADTMTIGPRRFLSRAEARERWSRDFTIVGPFTTLHEAEQDLQVWRRSDLHVTVSCEDVLLAALEAAIAPAAGQPSQDDLAFARSVYTAACEGTLHEVATDAATRHRNRGRNHG